VCYAREDRDFVRALTIALRDRGVQMWLDADIPPGADWDSSIDQHLRSCTSLLIVLSPAAVASTEVRGELRTALNLAKTIVPVLYQPCDIPRQLQNVQYLDLSSAHDADARRDALAAVLQSTPPDRQAHRRRPDRFAGGDLRNRQDFLADVKSEAVGRLAQSLPAGVLGLFKEQQPDQVTRTWDRDVRVPDQHRTQLGPDTRLVQIFDDGAIGGKLLVLGPPGSGKTTALLELCQELMTRAEQDPAEPLPVLCSLSSWREDRRALSVWLADYLKVKYGVRKDLGTAWLDDRGLVPLLDGLDEVDPEHQDACVHAINRFQQECRPPHLVVCCRLAEYENYPTKLQLHGAVRLLPLGDGQIRQYLQRAELAALWQSVSGDQETLELARSPLLLRVISVAYAETSPDEWQRLMSASERQAHLFDVYIRRVLSAGATERFTQGQTVEWLGWLAKTMQEHGQSELLIEHLQPTSLSGRQRLVYRCAVFVNVAIAFVLGIWLSLWLFAPFPEGAIGLALPNVAVQGWEWRTWNEYAHWLVPMVLGSAAGLIVASRNTIQPIETLAWSWTMGWRGLTSELRKGSLLGLRLMAYVGLISGLLGGVAVLPGRLAAGGGELARFGLAGLIAAGVALVTLVVAIVLTWRPSGWLVGGDPVSRGPAVDAVVSGLVFGAGATPYMGVLFGPAAGVTLGLIVRSGGASNLLAASRFADALVVGLIGGFGSGVIDWWGQIVKTGFVDTVRMWMLGGVGVAATVALFIGLTGGLRGRATTAAPAVGRLRQRTASLALGSVIAAASGLTVTVARHTGGLPLVRGIELISVTLGVGWTAGLFWALGFTIIAGVFGLMMGSFLGALVGVLDGLTGPDVERRTVPNQGIRQSAANVKVFALGGLLVVGVPWGLINLMSAAAITRVAPSALDWVNLALGSTVLFGVMGGLVPGAACIQHFTLRAVLWCFGLSPWRFVRFLNYATERMLLQRVGGRYRFIHGLLGEHLAARYSASDLPRNA
jgi:DNA polymerase III delta prime subunit